MIDEIIGTFVGRWYVTAFGVTFAVLALRHLGPRKTLIYTAAALTVGILAENGSASSLGQPYGRYEFNPALRGDEIWVGDVPLMVSLSYTFMAYFGFATARVLVAGPWRTRDRAMPRLEYALAVMLTLWMIWIVDPVSRLGQHYFLGDLFAYEGPGFWFGLHLKSQSGFLLTSMVLVGVLTWLMRHEPERDVDQPLSHPHLPAIGGYLGQIIFMAGTAFYVARTADVAADVKMADALAGAAVLIYVPIAFMVAVHWRHLAHQRRTAEAVSPLSAEAPARS